MTLEIVGAGVGRTGCIFWRELADFYPNANVLLSMRDPETWFESYTATIGAPGLAWKGDPTDTWGQRGAAAVRSRAT